MSKRSRRRNRRIHASAKQNKHQVIGMSASVDFQAAESGDDGSSRGPSFTSRFYTGGPLTLAGWDRPVVIDLEGVTPGNVLVANLDHDKTKRVANFDVVNDGNGLTAVSTGFARTAAREEVIGSAEDGYRWQASIEANEVKVESVGKGKTATANGQTFEGPVYVARESTLKGFGFVSHGADDDTTVTIAASADTHTEKKMTTEVRQWIEASLLLDPDELSSEQIEAIEKQYEGRNVKPKKATKVLSALDKIKAEAERKEQIGEMAEKACGRNVSADQVAQIQLLAEEAIESGTEPRDFRADLLEARLATGQQVRAPKHNSGLTDNVIVAAVCQTAGMDEEEMMKKHRLTDQELQAAHDRYSHGISLTEIFAAGAQANGYAGQMTRIDKDMHNAAMASCFPGGRPIQAVGFGNIDVPTILSNVANKFLVRGWNFVENAWRSITRIRSVSDFKTITTVSLTGDLMFKQVGATGEIKMGTSGETPYMNKADTYARMHAITRQDLINDDLGALTDVPMKLGRGGALKLNDIFWKEFLDNASFFTAGNNNVATGGLTEAGLDNATTTFRKQTDPDGNVLGAEPRILLTPVELEGQSRRLMNSELVVGSTDRADTNIWQNRYTPVSSTYMSNANYTGNAADVSYLLADPNDLPVIEVVALNGRPEPTVETADAAFNTLGVEMRGFSDVGVAKQEYRGGVRLAP